MYLDKNVTTPGLVVVALLGVVVLILRAVVVVVVVATATIVADIEGQAVVAVVFCGRGIRGSILDL